MGRLMKYWSRGSILGLVIMLFILPAIPCLLVWCYVAPASIWQMIIMIVVSVFLYIVFGIIELILLVIIAG